MLPDEDFSTEELKELEIEKELEGKFLICVSSDNMLETAYFFDSWLRLMGFGGEYQRLVKLANLIFKDTSLDLKNFRYLSRELKDGEKYE